MVGTADSVWPAGRASLGKPLGFLFFYCFNIFHIKIKVFGQWSMTSVTLPTESVLCLTAGPPRGLYSSSSFSNILPDLLLMAPSHTQAPVQMPPSHGRFSPPTVLSPICVAQHSPGHLVVYVLLSDTVSLFCVSCTSFSQCQAGI